MNVTYDFKRLLLYSHKNLRVEDSKILSTYSLRPEDVLGFYLNKRPCKFLLFSFVCEMCAETVYVCMDSYTQNSRKEPATQAGM